ncbi:MAG: type II CAAX prenyl endopeptidase Rce1 family protein [Promethearchaeota archaeon]
MENKELKPYSISKYTQLEILMDSQLQSAGAQQSRLLEKYKKNNKTIRNQARAMKIGIGSALLFIPIIPIVSYLEIFDASNTVLITSATFHLLSNLVSGIFFLVSLLYIMMGGLFATGSLMTGNAFKMLQILPISENKLKKIAVMTLFRNINIPIIMMAFSFPIVLLIATQSPLVFVLSLAVSLLNSLFGFSILIIIGKKISQLFSEEAQTSKRSNLIRIVTIVGYMILVLGTSLMLQAAISFLDFLIDFFSVNNPDMLLNIILSLIPLPITQGYIISLGIYPSYFSLELLISSIIGLSLFALLVFGLYRKAIQSLHEVTMTEVRVKKKKLIISDKKEEINVEIKSKTPLKSYIRKDIISASHDMQTFIYILLPVIYPIIMIVAFQGALDMNSNPFYAIGLWMIILGVFLLSPIMLIIGLLNMEESGSSIIASLPIVPRDQAIAKIILMMAIQAISLFIISIILVIMTNSFIIFLLLISSLPIAWSFLFLIFELKVFLFGKLKYKYILEELHKEHKIAKWVLIVLGGAGLYLLIIILGIAFYSALEIIIIISLIAGGISLLILSFVFTRMFPKIEKMQDFETGGFLRNHPITANVVLGLSYVVFLMTFTTLIELLMFPIFYILINENFIAAYILEIIIQFALLAIFWLFIIPFRLKLPTPQKTFKEYLKNIRLSAVKPVSRNILLSIATFGIFSNVVLFGAILLGDFVLDPNIIFGNPVFQKGLIRFGWLCFIIALIPGIWEEIAFRGVMLPMLLKKYNQKRAIVINSIIFGSYHIFNVLTLLFLGSNWVYVIFQVIYASFFGMAFAYIYIKTNSLLPGIILHYLIDSVGQLFLNVYFNNVFSLSFFLIGCIGIIPTFLIIIAVRFTVDDENSLNKYRASIPE